MTRCACTQKRLWGWGAKISSSSRSLESLIIRSVLFLVRERILVREHILGTNSLRANDQFRGRSLLGPGPLYSIVEYE